MGMHSLKEVQGVSSVNPSELINSGANFTARHEAKKVGWKTPLALGAAAMAAVFGINAASPAPAAAEGLNPDTLRVVVDKDVRTPSNDVVYSFGAGQDSGKTQVIENPDGSKYIVPGFPGGIIDLGMPEGTFSMSLEDSTEIGVTKTLASAEEAGTNNFSGHSAGSIVAIVSGVEYANEHPEEGANVVITGTPYREGALADRINSSDGDLHFAKPILDTVGVTFPEEANLTNLPDNMNVTVVTAGDAIFEQNGDYKIVEGVLDHYPLLAAELTGDPARNYTDGEVDSIRTYQNENGATITDIHIDNGSQVNRVIDVQAENARVAAEQQLPGSGQLAYDATQTVLHGADQGLNTAVNGAIDMANAVSNPVGAVEDLSQSAGIPQEWVAPVAEIAAPVVEQFTQPAIAEVPQADPIAAPMPTQSFDQLQQQIQSDFNTALNQFDQFAANNGFQLPAIPGLPR